MTSAHITPIAGTLKTWHEDRGFGFIRPDDGGRDLFVHISAFSPGASRPTVGEKLQFDLGAGRDGKPQAVRVRRPGEVLREVNHMAMASTHAARPTAHQEAPGLAGRRASSSSRARPPAGGGGGSGLRWVMLLLLALAAAGTVAYGWHLQSNRPRVEVPPSPLPATRGGNWDFSDAPSRPSTTSASNFRCDGRTHCSQMTSCAEATYFLQNCPGVKMDGNGDGVPCEQQWCGR